MLDYFIPDSPFEIAVVSALLAVAAVWAVWFIVVWWRTVRALRRLDQCRDVSSLADARRAATTSDDPNKLQAAEGRFDAFCEERSLPPKSLVTQHLHAIYQAGLEESRLDAQALLAHTQNRLFRSHGPLRMVLGVFIVIGLLGTLFGLSESLARLDSQALTSGSTSLGALSPLLESLGSAFAPSLIGVALTAVGAILWALFVQCACAPLQDELEHLTLTHWIPVLYPTTTQRLQETLARSEDQMHRNFEAAQKVADFAESVQDDAESIQDDVSDLDESVKKANQEIRTLTESSSVIKKFSQGFSSAVDELVGFQEDLQTLYKQMQDDSKAFQDSVEKTLQRTEAAQKQNQTLLKKQGEQLQQTLRALDSYEEAYVESRHEIDDTLQEVLKAARSVLEDIEDRNNELVDAIGEPLVDSLTQLDERLNARLQGVNEQLKNLSSPIEQTAQDMDQTLQTLDTRIAGHVKELGASFEDRNKTYDKRTKRIEELNQNVGKLLEALEDRDETHREHVRSLGDSAGRLAKAVSALNQNGSNSHRLQQAENSLGQKRHHSPTRKSGNGSKNPSLIKRVWESLRWP